METNSGNRCSHENQPPTSSNNANKDQSTENEVFVNCGGLHVMNSFYFLSVDVVSWTTTYEDLLCSTEPFQQSIPLAEMVDFLVDIWHEEGLYD
ncbi:hypothetical protein POUND7_001776 [Theobroma cacao]